MEKEILAVVRDKEADIFQFYDTLPPRIHDHCKSVADLTARLLEWGMEESGSPEIEPIPMETIHRAALFHDIGLAMIPERLLFKTGDLTPAEYRVIQKHTLYGATLLENYRKNTAPASERELWTLATEIALSHHEHWNGKGYPYGQHGSTLSLIVRAVAVADAYDAITRGAPFRMSLPPEYALLEIQQNAGTQFDPQLAEIFRKNFFAAFPISCKGGSK